MKESWLYKRLGEVASFINGYAFKPEQWTSSGTPIVRIQNLNNPDAPFNYYDGEVPDKVKIKDGDLLISWSASLGAYIWQGGDAFLNQHIFKVEFDKLDIDKIYLKYAVISKLNMMAGLVHGATMKHIVKKDFDNSCIPYPPINEQKDIVSELDKINELISLKKAQLKDLDSLAESIFYEMFGDPVVNEKNWDVKKLGDICNKIGSGATPRGGNKSYKNEGISLIRSLNVYNNEFKCKDLAFIDEKQADALSNVVVSSQDVLLNITGASVARCCIVPNDVLPARVNQHVCIIRPKSVTVPIYLNYLLTNCSYQNHLLSLAKSKAATREALPKSIVENLRITLPPLSLQQSFANRISAIEQQKKRIIESIKALETLLASRM